MKCAHMVWSFEILSVKDTGLLQTPCQTAGNASMAMHMVVNWCKGTTDALHPCLHEPGQAPSQ